MTGELICIKVEAELGPSGRKLYSYRFYTPKSQLSPAPMVSQIFNLVIVSEDKLHYEVGSHETFTIGGVAHA